MKKLTIFILILAMLTLTACSYKINSSKYIQNLNMAMINGDNETFDKLIDDERYNINVAPVDLIERLFIFDDSPYAALETACWSENY